MLDKLLAPNSIAIIGAAREEGKVGHEIFDNVINSGYLGNCYPINPKADEIHGHKCYPSVRALPEVPDLAVIIIPAKAVKSAFIECGETGVKAAIVISAGFKESGTEGAKLEKELIDVAAQYGIRFIGPNCLGLMNANKDLNISFAGDLPKKGNISFLSQSGALLTSILDIAKSQNLGFSKIVSLGNKADVSENDLLESWAEDPDTSIVVAYLEGVKDGEVFRKIASKLSHKKPIIALKSGTTDAGARAVSSHTGSLAGSQSAFVAAFKQSGVIQADSIQEMIDFAHLFSAINKGGDKVAIITNAGGPGILAADACEKKGLSLAALDINTVDELKKNLPAASNFYNPVDVLGDALADRYSHALEIVTNDPAVDITVVILTPQIMTQAAATAEAIIQKHKEGKSVIACFIGGELVKPGTELLRKEGIPAYEFPERAISAVSALRDYLRMKERESVPSKAYDVNVEQRDRIFEEVRRYRRHDIGDIEARGILEAYGFKVPETRLATNIDEAIDFSKELEFPVVMKITSPDILHKSDIGGIRLNLQTPREVAIAFEQIMQSAERFMPDATIWGVSVQKQVPPQREVILGMNKDPQFGPLLMFGLGGIYVEVLKDVSFRVAPIDRSEALAMIREIRSYPLLRGVRGEQPADIECIADALLRLSQLVTDCPQIVEMDINPLMIGQAGEGCIAVDARISIGD